ncbi:circadian input kinase A [Geminocystis sp. NIES-3708]|uniref:PAS domain-containing sensor histidine kinase n=1 Tax=Geminocystis sp. NIES-3708 TaxID=1615909 RepID=UPI0005FC6220|nr:PAS domain S-box protein [Geminocystis sp. NIES-3708]BAQ62640.1 circadian input kinase A [Geminocystis sp. NIES-3708]
MKDSSFNSQQFQTTLIKYSLFFPALTSFISILVIMGWIFHVDLLTRIHSELATMKVNTALCFIFLSTSSLLSYQYFTHNRLHNSFSLWQLRIIKSIINVLIVIVIIIATLTIIEYLFNLNFGIDELFIKDIFYDSGGIQATKAVRGRMGLNTAFCFVVLAFIQLFFNLNLSFYFLCELFSLVVFFIALLAFLGLIDYDAYFNNIESYTDMALHTSLNLMMLSISFLFRHPQRGLMKVISNDTVGGEIARSLLPIIIILSPVLCKLILIGYEQNFYTIAMGFNLLGISYIITFSIIVWKNAYVLDGIDVRRKWVEHILKQQWQQLTEKKEFLEKLNQQLEEEIAKREEVEIILKKRKAQYLAIIEDQTELICRFLPDGTILFVNQAYCKYYDIDKENIIGSKFHPVIYPKDLEKIEQMLDSLSLKNPVAIIEHRAIVKGEIRWMEWINRAIFDEENNFIEFQSVGRDIQEQKQAQIQIQQLNKQLQSLLDNAPLSISLFDEDGCYLDVNKAFSNKVNLPSEKIIGKTFEDLFPEYVCKIFRARLQSLKNNPRTLDIEDEVIINNQMKIFRSVLFPVFNENNIAQSFWAIAYDITEQKRTEISLRLKTQELNRFFYVAIDLLSIANLDGYFVRLNRQWEKTLGYSIKELEGAKFLDYIHPEDLEKTNEIISVLKNDQEKIDNFVNRYRCRDGSYRYIEWRSIRVNNLVYSAARDITERLKSEQILQQYERIVSVSNDAIALVSRDYIYKVVNPRYLDLHNKSYSEIINHHIAEILDPEAFVNIIKPKVELSLSGEIVQYEMWDNRDQQNPQYLSVTYSPCFEADKSISGIVVSIRNVTELKLIEQKIEASLKEKEVLLKEIHHRVKNNLQIIHSLLNLQSRSINDPSTAMKLQESQSRIQSMALIHEHLYQSDNLSEINLSEYLKELINVLFSTYQINTLSIEMKVKVEKNFFLDIDSAVPCGLIINELISNVLKYAFNENEKGKLLIVITADDQENLVLTIADNGKGLPPNLDWEKSTTLGLKLVKNLVRQLRGNIILDREEGTKYIITLTRIKGSPKTERLVDEYN